MQLHVVHRQHFSDGCYINDGYNAGFGDRLKLIDGTVPVLKDAGHELHAEIQDGAFCVVGHSVFWGILCFLAFCVFWKIRPVMQNIAVVLEEVVVLDNLPDLSTALAYLFGLLYVLNLYYPKPLKYTFDTIQNVFMELGSGCAQRVLSLKSKLM
ncbi:hypothetical protein IRJ41_012244 [Triplophysa rosa]|uniref:Uncharacterized protein n=1 Tax=Triplophysa rosa TaxID=992332 RepID=A0A9W7X013_TRIRA|nr:hypothetical protein IRJ41_012244 [Triplophysa rosa]